MADEFKFAIKCGSSTKKIQNSTTTAVPVKKKRKKSATEGTVSTLPKSVAATSAKTGVIKKSKSASSIYDECKRTEELLDSVTPQNAIVCKNKSSSSLSVINPGLLIVEKDDDDDGVMMGQQHYQQQYPMGAIRAPRNTAQMKQKPPPNHQLASPQPAKFPKQQRKSQSEVQKQQQMVRMKNPMPAEEDQEDEGQEDYDNGLIDPNECYIQETSFDARSTGKTPKQYHYHQSRRQVQTERPSPPPPTHRHQPKPQGAKHVFQHPPTGSQAAALFHIGRNLDQYDESDDYENNSPQFEQDHLLHHPAKMAPQFPVVYSHHTPHGQRHGHSHPHGGGGANQPYQYNNQQYHHPSGGQMKDFYLDNSPIPIHFDEKKSSKSPKVHTAAAAAKPRYKTTGYTNSGKMNRGDEPPFNYNEENSESNGDPDQERHEYEQETINYERFVKKSNIKKPVGGKNRPNR